jgi:hypothetical protein
MLMSYWHVNIGVLLPAVDNIWVMNALRVLCEVPYVCITILSKMFKNVEGNEISTRDWQLTIMSVTGKKK